MSSRSCGSTPGGVTFTTSTRSPPIAVATNSSGYSAATTVTFPLASSLLSVELHPVRISPRDATTASIERFFFIDLPYSFIDNDSN